MEERIIVRGAREHNLKGVDIELPRQSLIVFTGLSGSGKSSLAFDTIYQEGQRRFLESLSSYARQFLGQMEKPKVEHIEGLSPTICIDQKTINRNPRSTVGTITEIYDHLRLLFARLGTPHCPKCGREVASQTPGQVTDAIYRLGLDKRGMILAPIVQDRKGEYRKELENLQRDGYVRARIDGEIHLLSEPITLDRYVRHTIEVVLDRVVFDRSSRSRVLEGIEKAVELTNGTVSVLVEDDYHLFATERACPTCQVSIPELEPRVFSFNSPHGACPSCDGLGQLTRFHPDLVVPDTNLSIAEGAIACLTKEGRVPFSYFGTDQILQILPRKAQGLKMPWSRLPEKLRNAILNGDEELEADGRAFIGVLPALERSYKYTKASFLERFLHRDVCPTCDGRRLHPVSLAVTFHGKNIWQLCTQTVQDATSFFTQLKPSEKEEVIGTEIFKEIKERLRFLTEVGLDYLSLDRSAATLSGGEAQRIRLASQVGSGLQGVLYVLDEPSIGLHPRDNRKLIDTMLRLRDQGNTVIVVEHDRETMEAADFVVDIGPGAGSAGGNIISAGTIEVVSKSDGATGRFLRYEDKVEIPEKRRVGDGRVLGLRGVDQHNLQAVDVDFPLKTLTVVTGVSGSGKSTLVVDVLYRALTKALHGSKKAPGQYESIVGLSHVEKVIEIDQAPIGRTPRSNPATYTGVMDPIRELFADTPTARRRGFSKSRFSFNVDGGRCQHCKGSGVKVIEMQFLANVSVECEYCAGKRFNVETLKVRYRGKNIFDVLSMTIGEAASFFAKLPKISRILKTMETVGLGYVSLGQPSTTLSGGEAQRVKLASELHRPSPGHTVYILDEPSTGLHMADVQQLIRALQALVEQDNTIIVIEHNTDLMKVADHIIDMGPEGGRGGGRVVVVGTPEEIAACHDSHTGRAIRMALEEERIAAPVSTRRKASERVVDYSRDLVVTGAHCNNLKHVDVRIPHGKMTVVTGVSGSGKSTLAFDTLFSEGQRRYVESMSTYARRFLGRLEKAQVESIEGIAPAISVDQKTAPRNPRSTVATTTEIYDYFRLLFARAGVPHSPISGKALKAFSATRAMEWVLERFAGQRGEVLAALSPEGSTLAPQKLAAKPGFMQIGARELTSRGFVRFKVDGQNLRLDSPEAPLLIEGECLEVILDRVVVNDASQSRLTEAFENAFSVGDGIAWYLDAEGKRHGFSTVPACIESGVFLTQELTPRMFSFNSHVGACERCSGLGNALVVSPDRLVADDSENFFDGLRPVVMRLLERSGARQRMILEAVARDGGFRLSKPWKRFDKASAKAVLYGCGDALFDVQVGREKQVLKLQWQGLLSLLERYYLDNEAVPDRNSNLIKTLMVDSICPACHGERLKPLSLGVKIAGLSIAELCRMTVNEARLFLDNLSLDERDMPIAEPILVEIQGRLGFLRDVGLQYLNLDRRSSTLSGGEAQRIRLASQLGSHLVGVLYVLDEPTVGLHPRDTSKLLTTMEGLRDRGNTVVIVEHDPITIEKADYLIDMGPGAGVRGGHVVAEGAPADIAQMENSLTGAYLSGRRYIPLPEVRRDGLPGVWVRGARANNLRNVDVHFAQAQLICVTGVSGSGKSSLVMEILAKSLAMQLNRAESEPGEHDSVEIPDIVERTMVIDQSPIGRSPSSNPATYVNAMGPIRDLFAKTPESKAMGFKKGRFSFNRAEGRCSACEGKGALKVEMHFLSDIWVPCEVCKGRRFNEATLQIRFKGKTIADVLNMEVDVALKFFERQPKIHKMLVPLSDVGLGYVTLGQAATTLSGGEAQRVKLATALGNSRKKSVYILDEPTTGLHFADVEKLVQVLHTLVDTGHTVIVIEHNTDMMKVADWVIDMGPEGGHGGGQVVQMGTPEQVAQSSLSFTGQYLRPVLEAERKRSQGIS